MHTKPIPRSICGSYYHLEDFQQYLVEIHENCLSKNCWQAVEYFLELGNIMVVGVDTDKGFDHNSQYFEKVLKKEVSPYNILLFMGLTDSKYHFGVYLGDNYFIHQYNGTVNITKLNRLWRICWYATYKYPKQAS